MSEIYITCGVVRLEQLMLPPPPPLPVETAGASSPSVTSWKQQHQLLAPPPGTASPPLPAQRQHLWDPLQSLKWRLRRYSWTRLWPIWKPSRRRWRRSWRRRERSCTTSSVSPENGERPPSLLPSSRLNNSWF